MDSNDRITIIYFLVTGILMILAFQRLAGLFYFSLTVTCLLIVNPALDWLFTNNETGFDILQRILIFLMAVYLLFSDSSKKNIPGSLLAGALFSYLATIDPFYALPSLGIVFAELATSKGIFAKKQPWNFIQIVPVGIAVYTMVTSQFLTYHAQPLITLWPFSNRMEMLFGSVAFTYIIPFSALLSLHFTRRVWKQNFVFWVLLLGTVFYFYNLRWDGLFIEGRILILISFGLCLSMFMNRIFQFFQELYISNYLTVLLQIVLLSILM